MHVFWTCMADYIGHSYSISTHHHDRPVRAHLKHGYEKTYVPRLTPSSAVQPSIRRDWMTEHPPTGTVAPALDLL